MTQKADVMLGHRKTGTNQTGWRPLSAPYCLTTTSTLMKDYSFRKKIWQTLKTLPPAHWWRTIHFSCISTRFRIVNLRSHVAHEWLTGFARPGASITPFVRQVTMLSVRRRGLIGVFLSVGGTLNPLDILHSVCNDLRYVHLPIILD